MLSTANGKRGDDVIKPFAANFGKIEYQPPYSSEERIAVRRQPVISGCVLDETRKEAH